MLNSILFHFVVGKAYNENRVKKYYLICTSDSAMNTESGKIEDLAKQANEIYTGRKEQNRGSELLFQFSFSEGIIFGSKEKIFLKKLGEEEQCIFFKNLKISK